MLMYPMVLDAGQTAGDAIAVLDEVASRGDATAILVQWREGVAVRWYILRSSEIVDQCSAVAPTTTIAVACALATRDRDEASRCEVSALQAENRKAHGWLVVFSGARLFGVMPPMLMSGPPQDHAANETPPPAPPPQSAPPQANAPPPTAPPTTEPTPPPAPPPPAAPASPRAPAILMYPYIKPADDEPAPTSAGRGPTRGQHAKPPQGPAPSPTPAPSAPPDDDFARRIDLPASATAAPDEPVDTLLALPRIELDDRCTPALHGGVLLLVIGLMPPDAPTSPGVMTFVSPRTQRSIDIDVMVEAPDFTCDEDWKHTLTVNKSDPFTSSLSLHIRPLAPDDLTVRVATVRIHYSYKGQPAGMAVRRVALGDATLEDAEALKQVTVAPLSIAPSSTPVDLTIRIARRDESDAARELLWTLLDCAYPIALPNAPIVQKVGDRDTASSFAAKVTSQVNAADGTVTIDNMMRGIGTLIRRAMPPEVLKALNDVAASVRPDRLARILLLTDECFVPWELTLLDPAPNAARAPFLGAQFAVSRWIHGECDIPVPPPAALVVRNLAVVLGSYDASSFNALPHAKEESVALTEQAAKCPAHFPRVTSIDASPESMVDLLNGALPTQSGPLAPEMVHFACHGEVLGSGIAKRSVLYMSDGTALSETLFVASALGKKTKSFLFMNACQVGVGNEELGQYSGFPGLAISAGFSGFVGPLWSVNDQIAKGIALDFYARAFGVDGGAPRAVADVLSDMRSQYINEPDPKKRQSTWLAYVHYGHPHFTLSHA